MKSIAIDEAAGTATVGTGLIQKEAVAALGAAGYAIPTGSEGGVGLGGVVLGGGFGLLTRKMGLACDVLLAADVVVADGPGSATVIHADAENHADLLWACRGGGGNNFGITTSYTVKLHELADVAFLYAKWDNRDRLADILRGWQRDAPVADEHLSSALEIDSAGPGLSAVLYGGERDELMSALGPLLDIDSPTVTVTEDSWPTVYADVDKAPRDIDNWKFYSQFVKRPFPDEAIDLICQFMANAPSPASNYFLSSFGGAVRNAPAGGSAFPHRDALFYCEPGAGWNGCEPTSTALGWVADFARALRPYVDGAYVNVPNARRCGLGIRVLRLERVTSAAGEGHLRPAQRVRLRAEHSPSAALMTQPPATSKTSGTQKVRMSITPDDRDTADRWFLGRGMPAVLTSRARYRSPVATISAGVGRLCHCRDRPAGRVLFPRDQ